MNTVETCTIYSPFNKDEECAKFSIDTLGQVFTMTKTTVIGEQYTFSFWIKSEEASTLTTCDTTVESTTGWTKHTITFIAAAADVVLQFGVTGTYYIYHPMLEIGNKASDWSPSPEDVDQTIVESSNAIREVITEQTTTTMNAIDEKMDTALESYVDLTEYGEFKDVVSAQLTMLDDEINMRFPALSDKIENVDKDLQSKFVDMYKYITFSEDGITISASEENSMSIRIDNDAIKFEKNGTTFGWWDGINFNTGNITVNLNERAQFGNFAYVPRSDGSLSFLKVANFANFYATLNYGTMTIYGADASLDDTTLILSGISGVSNGTTLILGG